MIYIDISYYQGVPDFEKVKGNVDGVIIRAGYGRNNLDKQFERNIKECNRLGIPCGVYWFSYAYTEAMARAEAEYCLKAIAPYRLELPVAIDFEYDSVNYAAKNGVSVTSDLANKLAAAFCGTIESAGYYCMLYANPDFLGRYFTNAAKYDLWLAQYPKTVDVKKPPQSCGIWQWGGSYVPGINGSVDTNEAYKDYKAIIEKAGLNRLKKPETVAPAEKPEEGTAVLTMGFGEAIEQCKKGKRIRRAGWNGKNQYVELATCISYKSAAGEIVNCEHAAIGNMALAFVGTSGIQMGWLASQADMLATDWEIAN